MTRLGMSLLQVDPVCDELHFMYRQHNLQPPLCISQITSYETADHARRNHLRLAPLGKKLAPRSGQQQEDHSHFEEACRSISRQPSEAGSRR
jgi:hypothetical protein